MEKLVEKIKTGGFEKYRNQIDEKIKIKNILEIKVKNYQKKLSTRRLERKNSTKKITNKETGHDIYLTYIDVLKIFYLIE